MDEKREENEGKKELDYILQALSHEVRRKIVKTLAEKSPLTYTELMREVGVEDSGTFGFHLRRMQKLVSKSRTGEYQLSDLGAKAYKILLELEGKKFPVEEEKEPSKTMVVSDRLKFILTEEIAKSYVNRGIRIVLRDILKLIIKPMDRRVFDKAVEEIADCAIIYVPKALEDLVYERCRDISITKVYEREPHVEWEPEKPSIAVLGRDFSGTISEILQTVSSIIGDIPKLLKGIRGEYVKKFQHTLPARSNIEVYTSDAIVNIGQGEKLEVTVEGYKRESSRVDYDIRDDTVEVTVENSKCSLTIPKDIKNLNIDSNNTNSSIQLSNINSLRVNVNGGWSKMKLTNIPEVTVNINNGGIDGEYTLDQSLTEHSTLNFEVNGGVLKLEISIPEDVKVKVANKNFNGVSMVKINGTFVEEEYTDMGYEESMERVSIELNVYSGAVIVNIKKHKG